MPSNPTEAATTMSESKSLNACVPVNKLSAEILDEIFELVILSWDPKDFHRRDVMGNHWQRRDLMLVSKAWHQRILFNPKLWAQVFLNAGPLYSDDDLKNVYGILGRNLEKSGQRMRTLHLSSPGMVDVENAKSCGARDVLTIDPMISLPGLADFILSISNWQEVYIDLKDYPDFASKIFDTNSKPGNTWRSLQTLILESEYPPDEDGEGPHADVGKVRMTRANFPALRNVSLNIPCCYLNVWSLPWAQLRTLSLKDLFAETSDYLTILGDCAALEVLEVEYYPTDSDWTPNKQALITRVPRLRIVSIGGSGKNTTRLLLDQLNLPSLHSFTFSGDAEETAFRTSFLKLLKRSSVQPSTVRLEITEGSLKGMSTAFLE
ncbi:hypothetical protein DFP72DRAFT_549308 [Ephemerocybe angulata]|uniref:F-box domain-containing protein n=1 Tax=Ephemerocybe angulata TaxID=980116 RepID=A0A8H6M2G1_9AGAR|nr:hypothetical protein DFP72DRAFT_549308 [Tulosesus angulatus]